MITRIHYNNLKHDNTIQVKYFSLNGEADMNFPNKWGKGGDGL